MIGGRWANHSPTQCPKTMQKRGAGSSRSGSRDRSAPETVLVIDPCPGTTGLLERVGQASLAAQTRARSPVRAMPAEQGRRTRPASVNLRVCRHLRVLIRRWRIRGALDRAVASRLRAGAGICRRRVPVAADVRYRSSSDRQLGASGMAPSVAKRVLDGIAGDLSNPGGRPRPVMWHRRLECPAPSVSASRSAPCSAEALSLVTCLAKLRRQLVSLGRHAGPSER